ncbi:Acylphosphatase-like domain [Phytophthora cinnamomi]|uniref:Acylphosphatase-like domain n=1 Tax=Phytophthora cinnamomi TaxID=4785 RepID=UPI003559A78A|nr:Acylphosphatase-like domain [Phytophthora cinnamomi]
MSEPEQQDSSSKAMDRWLEVRGKVQNVMFRQTVIRAMQKRGLEGGATNDRQDRNLVRMTLRGDPERMEGLVAALREGKPINDWGARATSVEDVDAERGLALEAHQVTTATVDNHRWNPNITMFL